MEYSISEMCKLTGVSKDTLRYYDKINLITPKREASKYRTYNDKDVMLAKYIQVLKYIGYSLDEIREVLVLYYLPVGEDCTKRLKYFFESEIKEIIEKIRKMEQILGILNEGKKHIGEKEGMDNLVLNIFEIIKPEEECFDIKEKFI